MQWWCVAEAVPWNWQWRAYPGVWLFVLMLAGLYRLARGRWPEEDRTRFRGWMFGLGLAALWIALDWPVGALGAGYLASVHMIQYLLIALIAPPLVLIGLPRGLFRSLADSRLRPVLTVVTHPIPAIAIFVSVMAWTHWPPVVDTLMVTQWGSFLLDLLWLISGTVFWWPVAAPEPARRWLQEPAKVGYLILATLVNTGVFAYLTFSPLPLYATYELAPPISALSTRDDQLLAGLFMKMGGAVILWTAISILFFRWFRTSEAEDRGGRRQTLSALLILFLAGCGVGEPAPEVSGADSEAALPAARWVSAGPLEVAGPVIGEPPAPERAALYLRIRNPGASPVRVEGVRIEGVGRADFHETRLEEGIMRMTPVGELEIPPGGTVELRPGGLHVMLSQVERSLVPGDTVEVHFVLAGGGQAVTIRAPVIPLDLLEARLEGRL